MADNNEGERRANSVAISGAAVKIVAALAAAFVISVTSVLWDIVLDHQRLDERVTALWDFGPHTGGRFTKENGDQLTARVYEIERDVHKHERLPHHSFAGQRLDALIKSEQRQEAELRYLRQELQIIRNEVPNNGR